MKIVLLLLNEAVARINKNWVTGLGRMAYAPTTLTQLAALVPPELNANIEIIDEGVSSFDPLTIDADLVGLSVLTPNAPRAYHMAAILKSRGITVVMGGVHASLVPEEMIPHADAVVVGYAEKSWPQLLHDFASHQLKKVYTDFEPSYFQEKLPIPRFDLQKNRKYFLPYTFEATRGCHNRCSFCVIASCPHFSSFLVRDIDQVVSQIRQSGAKNITFLDSSPTENMEYIKRLYTSLIPLKIRWNSSVTLKIAEDDEWFSLAVKSGCKGVLLGFESLNQDSLTAGNKNFNQVKRYPELIRKLHKHGISVLGCFVFGFDSDTPDIFRRTVDFVIKAKIDILNFTILTPYPQTGVLKQLQAENRIIETGWEHYNGTRVVFQPANMSVKQLQEGYEWACLKAYSAGAVVKRLMPPRSNFAINMASNIYFSVFNHLRFK